MSFRDFCYWLQGYIELVNAHNSGELSDYQLQIIKDHLKLCFEKETPNYETEINYDNWVTYTDPPVDMRKYDQIPLNASFELQPLIVMMEPEHTC